MPRGKRGEIMWAIGTAAACGGFFCSGGGTTDYGSVPVEQNSERILFVVNGDETVTTFVEVGYQLQPEARGQGYAIEAVRAMFDWARATHMKSCSMKRTP